MIRKHTQGKIIKKHKNDATYAARTRWYLLGLCVRESLAMYCYYRDEHGRWWEVTEPGRPRRMAKSAQTQALEAAPVERMDKR